MTPASTLRDAATRLREAAEAATPGPWTENVLGSEGYDVRGPEVPALAGSRVMRRPRVARCGYEQWEIDKANAAYIALVDPVVGAKLADWLDSEAQAASTWADVIADSGLDRSGTHAMRVARSILGETGEE